MNNPQEPKELSKYERRKQLKEAQQKQERTRALMKKLLKWTIAAAILAVVVIGFMQLTKKSPEQIQFEQDIQDASLEGVEEFPIEGRTHVEAGTEVKYQTNPPTSGDHLSQAKEWGVFTEEISDLAAVHSLEHGGIWISYKDISDEEIAILEEVGRENPQSTLVSPRSANDDSIVVASWGRMMVLETADKAAIQKYIDTYKNDSPEKLAL